MVTERKQTSGSEHATDYTDFELWCFTPKVYIMLLTNDTVINFKKLISKFPSPPLPYPRKTLALSVEKWIASGGQADSAKGWSGWNCVAWTFFPEKLRIWILMGNLPQLWCETPFSSSNKMPLGPEAAGLQTFYRAPGEETWEELACKVGAGVGVGGEWVVSFHW